LEGVIIDLLLFSAGCIPGGPLLAYDRISNYALYYRPYFKNMTALQFSVLTWICAGLSIVGAILNICKKRYGFIVWIMANVIWVYVDFKRDLPAQAYLFILYSILNAWGFIYWRHSGINLNQVN